MINLQTYFSLVPQKSNPRIMKQLCFYLLIFSCLVSCTKDPAQDYEPIIDQPVEIVEETPETSTEEEEVEETTAEDIEKTHDVDVNKAAEAVFVRFKNISNERLENIEIADKKYGSLSPERSTGYFKFAYFGEDTGMPDMPLIATIDDVVYESFSKYFFCGTQKGKLENGYYTVTIEVRDSKEENLLNLSFE